MEVCNVIVGSRRGTIVVNQGIGIPDVVIPEVQGLGGTAAGNGLPQQHAAGVDIAVLLRHGREQLPLAAVAFRGSGYLILFLR